MKKILSMLVCLVLAATFATSPLKASASTATAGQNEQLIQLLMQMITILQQQLQVLIQQSANTTSVTEPSSTVVDVTTGSFKNSSLTSYSENPIIRGTATGLSTVGFSIDDGGKMYGSGQFSVINGVWSHKVSTDLQPGTYGIRLYDASNNEIDRGTLTVNFYEDGAKKQNLSISAAYVSYPDGSDLGAIVQPVSIKQNIAFNVVNNASAPDAPVGKGDNLGTFEYIVELYEVADDTQLTKISTATKSGEAVIPFADTVTELTVGLDMGTPFSGDYEKYFKAKITIDTTNGVDEANESDNVIWTNKWLVTYYKG